MMVKKRVKQRRISAKQAQRKGNANDSLSAIDAENGLENESLDQEQTTHETNNVVTETLSENNVTNGSSKNQKIDCLPSPVGLHNLGNTCFFNSVIQNLYQTPVLYHVLKHHQKLADNKATAAVIPAEQSTPPLTYAPALQGKTTLALINFFESVKASNASIPTNNARRNTQRTRVVSPKPLFNQICASNSRFQGYQQQDSQELLHALLDSIKTEDVKRRKLGILRALNLERAVAKNVSEEMRRKVKAYGIAVTQDQWSTSDVVFGGTIRSSVLCDNCGTVTGVTEPFCDISLPILDPKQTFHPKLNGAGPKRGKNTSHPARNGNSNAAHTNGNSTPSKHARKKAKQEAKRNSRKAQKTLNHDSSTIEDSQTSQPLNSTEQLACEMAKMAICNAITVIGLQDKMPLQNDSSDIFSTDNPKVKGGSTLVDLPSSDEPPEAAGEESEEQLSSDEELKNISTGEQTTEKDSSEQDDDWNVTTPKKSNGMLDSQSLFNTPLHAPAAKSVTNFCRNLPVTLSPRYQPKDQECSVQSCLHQFTMAEMLTGSNSFGCEHCTENRRKESGDAKARTVYCNASKQMLISRPPAALIIHLKRFHQVGCGLRKVNKHVDIPVTLDLAPFCDEKCREYADPDLRILYHLYGIVEHAGSLSRGHYTAYVKVRPPNPRLSEAVIAGGAISPDEDYDATATEGAWFHISDSSVSRSTQAKALASNAYLLFYERAL